MKREEFSANLQASKKHELFIGIFIVGFLAIGTGLLIWVDGYLHLGKVHFSGAHATLTIGILVLTMVLSRRSLRKYALNCPSCSKPLGNRFSQITIETGNCHHCGTRVLE